MRIPIILTLGVCLTACQKEVAPPPPPKSISELHKDIAGVFESEKDDALEILLVRKTLYSDSSVVAGIARDAIEITRGMRAFLPAPSKSRIRFTAAVPVSDKYGNTTQERIISITFHTGDLMKINVDESRGILPSQLLNLYEKVWRIHPLSSRAIRAYCGEEIAKMSREFCRAEAIY